MANPVSAPFIVNPPFTRINADGSMSLFIWESALYPETRDASERLMEVVELSGKVAVFESDYTRPADIVL